MHIIDWIVKMTDPTKTKHLKKTGELPKSEDPIVDNADLRHKVCTKCSRVWELISICRDTTNKKSGKKYTYGKNRTHYYYNMVTYGKQKETCPECLEKEKK